MKYLKQRYFGKQVESANQVESAEQVEPMAMNSADACDPKGKAPKNIQENINLLRRLMDRQARDLAELNRKIDAIIREAH